MNITVTFPGGARVDARLGDDRSEALIVRTDQPVAAGGAGSAPSPFAVFLASIATCAGYYVLSFCQKRGLSTDGLEIVQRVETDPATGMVGKIVLDVRIPASIPEKYHEALVRAAEHCKVKKHLEHPPAFEIRTETAESLTR